MNNQTTKRCPRCKQEYPRTAEFFITDKRIKDGVGSSCRVCERIRNREDIRKRRQEDPEMNARYYAANKDRERARLEKWQKENPQRANLRHARYKRNHPDKVNANNERRRARKLNAEGSHTAADIQAQHKRQKGRCYYCGVKVGKKYHVDHVIPLTRGGSNWPSNLVITCYICNMSKHDKLPHEWPRGGRLL